MMKKLLKNSILVVAFITACFSFGQVDVTFGASPGTIYTDGTLENPLVLTISNIPNDSGVGINSRAYEAGTPVSMGGHDANLSSGNFNLDQTSPDVDVETHSTMTTLNTPSAGFFTRVFTIKKYPPTNDGLSGITSADLAIRITGAFSVTPPLTFANTVTIESGGNASNASIRLSTGLNVAVLSTKNFDNISKSIYPNPATDVLNISKNLKTDTYKVISILGNTIKEVKATGSLNVSDLPGGVYFLITDVGTAKFVKR